MLLSKEIQVEEIDLYGEVNSLGFHIFGGKSTGVAVQAILANGVAHRDGRLRPDDHIVMINESCVRGLGCEHVAAVLRLQKGDSVRFTVARSVSEKLPPTSADATVILTKDLDVYLKETYNLPDRVVVDSDEGSDDDWDYGWEYGVENNAETTE